MRQKILRYANDKFGKTTNFLIAGSYLTPNFGKYSDIDIVIFQDKIRKGQNHTVLIDDMKIQFVVIPLSKLSSVFYDDYKSHRGSFCHMVANAVVAFENKATKQLKEIVEHANILLNTPRINRSEIDIYQLRYIVTNHILDLKSSKENKEMMFTVFELLHHLSSLKMLYGHHFITGGGRHKYRALQKNTPQFVDDMEYATKEFFTNGNLKPLISFAVKVLKQCGGELILYTKSKVLTQVNNEIMLISIAKKEFSENQKLIENFLNRVQLKNRYNVFLQDDLIYLEIRADKDFINSELIGKLELECANHHLKMNFPLRMEFEFEFSQIQNYYKYVDALNKIQSKLSKWLNDSNGFLIFYSLLTDFRSLFKSNSSYRNFLQKLFENFLPFYYDDASISSSQVLLNKKENAQLYFDEIFIKNKIEYQKMYLNSQKEIFKDDIKDISQILKTEINSLIAITHRHSNKHFFFIYRFLSMLMIEDQYKPFLVYTFMNLKEESNA